MLDGWRAALGARARMGGTRIGAWDPQRGSGHKARGPDGWHGIGFKRVAQGLGLSGPLPSFLSRRDFVRVLVTVTAVVIATRT